MILKNMKNYLKNLAIIGSNLVYTTYAMVEVPNSLVDTTGTTRTTFCVANSSYSQNGFCPVFSSCTYSNMLTNETSDIQCRITPFAFGSDNTEVTENDYKLGSIIASGLSMTSSTFTCNTTLEFSDDGNSCDRKVKLVLSPKNTSSNAITINEVGIYGSLVYSASSQSSQYRKNFLLHREVLSEPLVIEPNAIGTVELNFTFTNSVTS